MYNNLNIDFYGSELPLSDISQKEMINTIVVYRAVVSYY